MSFFYFSLLLQLLEDTESDEEPSREIDTLHKDVVTCLGRVVTAVDKVLRESKSVGAASPFNIVPPRYWLRQTTVASYRQVCCFKLLQLRVLL